MLPFVKCIRAVVHLEVCAGTGTLSVVAGVGNLPAQLAMTKRLLDSARPFPVTAPWPVAIMALYTVLNQYGDAALDAPISVQKSAADILGIAEETTVCAALTAAVDYALDAFDGLTAIPRLGLMYYPERAFPGWVEPEDPNVSLILAVRHPEVAVLCMYDESLTVGCPPAFLSFADHTCHLCPWVDTALRHGHIRCTADSHGA